ncbi:MAG: hypothetical protein ACRDBP_17535 [Luteolibacter sp.]
MVELIIPTMPGSTQSPKAPRSARSSAGRSWFADAHYPVSSSSHGLLLPIGSAHRNKRQCPYLPAGDHRSATAEIFKPEPNTLPINAKPLGLPPCILNNPTIVTASGSGKTFKPQDFLDLVAEVKHLDSPLDPKIHALNAGRLLSQEQGRAGLLKLIDNKSASGSTGNFLELLVTRGLKRGAFNTNGVVRVLIGFRVALGRSDIDHIILENGQEFVVQTKLSGAAWDSYAHFVNWVVASNKALGKTVDPNNAEELWKSVRVAMPDPDEIPPKLLFKLEKKLQKTTSEVRQWLKDEHIVIDVSSVYD